MAGKSVIDVHVHIGGTGDSGSGCRMSHEFIFSFAFAAMLEPGVFNISIAVAVIYIPTYFRLVRGQTLTIKEEL